MSSPYKTYRLTVGSGSNNFTDTTGANSVTLKYIGLPFKDAGTPQDDGVVSTANVEMAKRSLSGPDFASNYQPAGSNETATIGEVYAEPPGSNRTIFVCLVESDAPLLNLDATTSPVVASTSIVMGAAAPAQLWSQALTASYPLNPSKYYNAILSTSGGNVVLFDGDGAGGNGQAGRDTGGTSSLPTDFENLANTSSNKIVSITVEVAEEGSPTQTTPYPDLSSLVGDVVDEDLAGSWANPAGLTFEIFQNPETTENIVGLPGACSIVGELTTRRAYSVQVKATDVLTGNSTLSNVFTWSVEQLAINPSVALDLSGQPGSVIGLVEITAFDVAVTDLDSGTDLIPRKLYARVTGDVVLIGLDGIQFTHTVVAAGIQEVGFVQINSVGTTGTIDDYDGLL